MSKRRPSDANNQIKYKLRRLPSSFKWKVCSKQPWRSLIWKVMVEREITIYSKLYFVISGKFTILCSTNLFMFHMLKDVSLRIALLFSPKYCLTICFVGLKASLIYFYQDLFSYWSYKSYIWYNLQQWLSCNNTVVIIR